MTVTRSGGLMLCQCRHAKVAHRHRPLYYLPPQGDSQGNPAPLTPGEACYHCDCAQYVQGEYQGFALEQEGSHA